MVTEIWIYKMFMTVHHEQTHLQPSAVGMWIHILKSKILVLRLGDSSGKLETSSYFFKPHK